MMFSAFLWWKQLWIVVKAHFSQQRNICPLPDTRVPSIKVCTCKSTNYRRYILSVKAEAASRLCHGRRPTLYWNAHQYSIINQYDYYLSFNEGITSSANCESDRTLCHFLSCVDLKIFWRNCFHLGDLIESCVVRADIKDQLWIVKFNLNFAKHLYKPVHFFLSNLYISFECSQKNKRLFQLFISSLKWSFSRKLK